MNSRSAFPTVHHLFHIVVLVCVLLVSGCAVFAPPRPFATEAEALAVNGEPTRRWQNGDGTTTLEYATQPYGNSCLMVQVDDASGIVVRQWDALDRDNLARVRQGMSIAEVERLLGAYRSEQFFKRSGELVLDWNIYNHGPGIATLFNVHFIDGHVVRTSQTYVYPRDNGGFGYWGGDPFGYSAYSRYPFAYPYYYPYGYSRYRGGRYPNGRAVPLPLPPLFPPFPFMR